MQWFRAILYNASIFSLFYEFKKKYPQPVIIYEDTMQVADPQIYQALAALNSPWMTKSLEHQAKNRDEIHSLHVFCVDNNSNSLAPVLDNILTNSNSFRIQNLILTNDVDVFVEHERLHRNTLICERVRMNITCWHWVNRYDSGRTLQDLLYGPVNLNLSEIQINAYSAPPNAFVRCLSGRFIFTGLDAMVTAEIMSKLNATPKYCNEQVVGRMKSGNCNKKDAIEDDDAVKLMRQLKVNEKTQEHHLLYHTVFDSRMIKYLFFKDAECDGSVDLKMNTGAMNFDDNMIVLLPTEFSCMTILVPRASAASSFIRRTIYNSVESIGFMCTVLLFTIGRIIVSRPPFKQWFSVLYSTFAVFLTQATLKPKSLAERILYGVMLLTSVFTTVMLSSFIFINLVDNPSSKPIQTLDDLAASNYKILTMKNIGDWMEHLRADIREKMVVVDNSVITQHVLTMDKSSSYAIAANYDMVRLFTEADSSSLKYKFSDIFYKVGEKLHCGYYAYRISNDFPLEADINQIIQRMVDHGFIAAFKNWSLNIVKQTTLFTFTLSDKDSPFTLEHIFGIFCLYLGGIGISFVVFLGERIAKVF